MCKSGELVAEADHVDALHGCGVREAVVLLLLLIVQDVVLGIGDEAVHIIVPSCYHLEEEKIHTHTISTRVVCSTHKMKAVKVKHMLSHLDCAMLN